MTRERDAGRYPLHINWNRLALPGLILLAAGFLAPMLLLAVYSIFRDGANGQVVGDPTLANYAAILTDPFYLRVLRDTVLLGLAVTVPAPVSDIRLPTSSRGRARPGARC